jgi:septal ring factor EnvC (AmiA/AmiB activator)
MLGARTSLIGGALIVGLVSAIATAAPRPTSASTHASVPTTNARHSLAADMQLIRALHAHIGAAQQLERATLAAIDQRLRAIYALPGETPLTALLTGNAAEAQAMVELTSAMTQSDNQLLASYTNSLANLQIAEGELAQNALRINAKLRIAAAQRAAALARSSGPRVFLTTRSPSISSTGGLPAAIISHRTLPGAPPVNPVTGRAIVVPT